MKKNKSGVLKLNNPYKKFLMLILLCLVILAGCANQEATEKTEENNSEENEVKQVEEVSVEDQKRLEKAKNIEKHMIKYMEEKRYTEILSYFKDTFIRGADKELKPTEKTIELYNLAVQTYMEGEEMFGQTDYQILSLDKGYLSEDVKSFMYQKFGTEIKEMEASIEKEKAERIASAEVNKAEREAREEAERIEESKNRVYIGMTKEQVVATNLGEPDDINRTITADGVSEQWVYSDYGTYLYFEDGFLVTIQD